MIQIITNDGTKYDYTDVYDMFITSDTLYFKYQHPEQDPYICSFNLSEIKHISILDSVPIRISVKRERLDI